jgi:hypothetical protein
MLGLALGWVLLLMVLALKYPQPRPVPTLCGELREQPCYDPPEGPR